MHCVSEELRLKLTDRIFELTESKVRELGYELYDVEYQKEYDNWVLTLYIDSKDGISLDDCEIVSDAVDPILDEADPIEQAYYLSVSSVGINRPLKKDKDFQRSIGKTIDVKLYAPLKGKKEFCGELVSFDAESFTVRTLRENRAKLRKRSPLGAGRRALVRPHIDFKHSRVCGFKKLKF